MADVSVSGTGFDTLLIELVKYGVFGVLFGLLIIAYREKLKEVSTIWSARLDDNKQILTTANATNKTYEEVARSMESSGQSLQQMAAASQTSAKAMERQAEILDLIRRIAEQNQAEMKRVADAYERVQRDNSILLQRFNELYKIVEELFNRQETTRKSRGG